MNDLTPLIQSHYLNGVPTNELTDKVREQKRLNDLFSLFDMYHENPCMDIRAALKYRFRHNPAEIAEDMTYFEMMRTRFTRMTRQQALDMVNWAAQRNMMDAAAVNDRNGIDKAARLLIKANQLDKPAVETQETQIKPMQVIYTPYIEVVDPDRHTIKDKQLKKIMQQYDADMDEREIMIDEKLEAMKRKTYADDKTEQAWQE
jgi:hypothetical protein